LPLPLVADVVDSAEHRALARKMATKSVVLLKNLQSTLPLALTSASVEKLPMEAPANDLDLLIAYRSINSLPMEAPSNDLHLVDHSEHSLAESLGATKKTLGAMTNLAVIGPNANRPLTLVSNYPGCKSKPGGPLDPTCTLITPLAGIQKAVANAAQAQTQARADATGTGTSAGTAFDGDTPQGMAPIAVKYEQGCEIDSQNRSGFEAATAAAAEADVVVLVMGIITCQEQGPMCQEAEAKDRVDVALPGVQLDLVQAVVEASAGKTVILILMGGGTVSVPWAAESPAVHAVIQLFYPGEEGGNALADILFGNANPSGRMPEQVVTGLEQLPEGKDYLNMSMSIAPGRTHRYLTQVVPVACSYSKLEASTYSKLEAFTYSKLEASTYSKPSIHSFFPPTLSPLQVPLYQFGFGLSYATRTYSSMKISPTTIKGTDTTTTVKVTAQLQCTTGMSGEEVVQLYTAFRPTTAEARSLGARSVPLRELKAFKRVTVPCGSKTHATTHSTGKTHATNMVPVSFEIKSTDLKLVDTDGTYHAIPGE
jgi:hypothetical protein